MSLAIAVTTIQRPQVIQRFVSSVRQCYPDVPIYVADQSRDIGAMMPFYDAHRVSVIRMPYDAGVTASRNRLVAAMHEDYFVLCDDDFVFGAETRFADALKILEAQPGIGVVGGKLYDFDGATEQPRHWELFFEYDRKNRLLITTPIYQLAPIVQEVAGVRFYLCDAVMNFAVFRRSIFGDTVRWDERFKSNGEHEDFYLNLKVNSTIQVGYLPTMIAYHHRSETYNAYHRQLRGREQGWAEFLRKWNLEQHLEIGYGVRSIENVGTVFDAERARQRFLLDDELSPERREANPGAVGIGRDGAPLRRKYALEPGFEETEPPAADFSPLFFRYRAIHTRDADFSLWYRGAPAPASGQGGRLPIRVRWYGSDGRVPVGDVARKVLDLAETAYWKPLLLEVPRAPPGPAVMRFEIVAERARHEVTIATGFLLCAGEDAGAEQGAGGDDVLALSCLSPAELEQLPATNAAGNGSGPAPADLALELVRPGPGQGLAMADIGRLPERSLLLFKGWTGFDASLVAARLPDAALDAPKQVALPDADLAGGTARLDLYDAAHGAVGIALRPPNEAGHHPDADFSRPERRRVARRGSIGAVFRGFWHGGPLSRLHRACLQSFVRQGHVFELYTYQAVDAGPGVVLKDANDVLRESEIFYRQNSDARGADIRPFSDLFRLKLLSDAGGWWCDVDTFCLADAVPDHPYAWARDNPETHPARVGTSLLKCPTDDPIFKELYRRCNAHRHAPVKAHEHFGAATISQLLTELGLPLDIGGNPQTFNPVRSIEMFKLWLPDLADEVTAKSEAAMVMPIHASLADRIGIDFSILPPEGSFLARMYEEYSVKIDKSPCYTSEEIRDLYKSWILDEMEWALAELIAVSGEQTLEYLGLAK